MADQTSPNIDGVLQGWDKISPEKLSDDDKTYFIHCAQREGIEMREPILELVQLQRVEPKTLVLSCPFCDRFLELRLYCDELRKCEWCAAFLCIQLKISQKAYIPYAIAKLPKGYFTFANLVFPESRYWYLKEILQIADNWKSPLTFQTFKKLIRNSEEELRKEQESSKQTK